MFCRIWRGNLVKIDKEKAVFGWRIKTIGLYLVVDARFINILVKIFFVG